MIQRHIDICERLCLYALGGIDHKHRAVAGRERAGHFIIKVNMSGRVDQVENILLAVGCAIHRAGRLALDCDTALPLELHRVQNLILHLPLGEQARLLDDAIGERGFSVVNVGNDTKVSDMLSVVSRHASSIKTVSRLRLSCLFIWNENNIFAFLFQVSLTLSGLCPTIYGYVYIELSVSRLRCERPQRARHLRGCPSLTVVLMTVKLSSYP